MIAFANDHAGIELKKELMALLDEMKLSYKDLGTNTPESTDYPLWGYKAAMAVQSGECDRAIVICGTGIGMSLTANKVRGIRCAVCTDCYSAKMSRAHNNANVLALGARVVGPDLAKMIVRTWLETSFEEGGRHTKRVSMIMAVEAGGEPAA